MVVKSNSRTLDKVEAIRNIAYRFLSDLQDQKSASIKKQHYATAVVYDCMIDALETKIGETTETLIKEGRLARMKP